MCSAIPSDTTETTPNAGARSHPLRVLLLEDNADDAELLLHELRQAGFDPTWDRVETEAAFRARLADDLDVILADYTLPQCNALGALRVLSEHATDVPFIVVTGSVSEEVAVACMKQGAADYLLKDRLARLGPAVHQALGKWRVRQERREAHEALQRSEALNRSILRSLMAHIAVLDQEGTIIAVNEAWRRFARENDHPDPAHDVGTSYLDVCRTAEVQGDALAGKAGRGIEAVLRGARSSCSMEYPCHAPDTERWFVMQVTPLKHEQGGAVVAHQDITERKLAEAQLIEAKQQAKEMSRLKSSLLSTMSHEIRTPLTAIIGFTELLDDEVPEAQHPHLAFIKENAERLLATLRAVLKLSMLKAGSLETRMVMLDIRKEVEERADAVRPQAKKKGLNLYTDLPETPIHVRLGRDPLHQILKNLLDNAIKFTEQGHVAIAVRSRADRVEIEIRDTGIGISEAFLSHAFDAFQQESTGMSRSYEGAGLGLTVAKGLVELMGGEISLTSTHARGTNATVSFPRKTTRTTRASRQPSRFTGDGK